MGNSAGWRRNRGFGEQVDDHAHHDLAHAEIRVIKVALNREVDHDLAVEILEQRHPETDRQFGRIGAMGGRTERELVYRHDIGRVDFLAVELELGRDQKLAAREFVTGVFAGVGAEGQQIHVLNVELQVHELGGAEGIEFALDRDRTNA
ncbi:MAG: hypothetical protein ABSE59_08535, partial [Opitutaceae bacterium]